MKTLVPQAPPRQDLQWVGRPVRRPDAPEKVTGQAKYIDDLAFAGMLHAAVIRSPHARARIVRIDAGKAREMPGVHAVVTAADIPGKNMIPMVQSDWIVLAHDTVNHVGEGVVLIAAETREIAKEAAASVTVEYEPLEAVLSIEAGYERQQIHTHWQLHKGDADRAFADPALHVFEETYHTPYQEHAYLETNGMVALPDGLGGIVVYGSLQCPFYVQKAVASVLGMDMQKVRIVQMTTGGGFGGKEDAPSAPGAMCALLAWITRRPVKLVFSREEDMICMTKRHPGKIRYKTAVTRDGLIQAVDVDYYLDGGAYATLSPVVLWRGLIHATGPYRVPNVRVHAYAVKTNNIPCGAFRGFGEPQVIFAAEAHWDHVAAQLGLDPVDFRMRNVLDYGDETPTGHRLDVSVGMAEVVQKVLDASDWKTRDRGTDRYRKGKGVAFCHYGVGLGALGRHLNPAAANVVVAVDGSVVIAVGTTELGQGMVTVLSQIAAEELGCPMELVRVVEPDTSRVPDSGPTVASRTTLMSGNAVRHACQQIKERMQAWLGERQLPWREAVTECTTHTVQMAAQGWSVPPKTTFDVETGQGDPYVTYTWCANTVEVTVDTETGEVTVDKVVSGHDVGKVINPQTGAGQVEGGVVQGLGYALVEEHHTKDGRILNNQFATYIIPTAMDIPEIVPILVEHAYPWGPFGAKGLGETPLIPVAPAVVNAIADAVGVRLTQIPATPERVWAAMQARNGQ